MGKAKKGKGKLKLKIKGKKAKKGKKKKKAKKAKKAKKGKKRQLQTVTPQTMSVKKTGVDVAKAYPETGLAEMKSEPAPGQSSSSIFKIMLLAIIGLFAMMF